MKSCGKRSKNPTVKEVRSRFWKWRAIGVFKMEMWYDEGHILGRLSWYVDATDEWWDARDWQKETGITQLWEWEKNQGKYICTEPAHRLT